MPTDSSELRRLIALANTLRTTAQALSDHAFELWMAGELSDADYDLVGVDYMEIVRRVQQLHVCGSRLAASELAPLLDMVEGARGTLEQHLDRIDQIKDVLTIATKMLRVAATLVTAVTAPGSAGAAVTAITDLVQTWMAVSNKEA